MQHDVDACVQKYVNGAIRHGEGGDAGEPDVSNAGYRELMQALLALRSFGELGRNALLRCLEHENISVRCWAATHSLRTDEEMAKRVLNEISRGSGPVAFNAEMVLEEWRKGRLMTP